MIKFKSVIKMSICVLLLITLLFSCSKEPSSTGDDSETKKAPSVKTLEIKNILYNSARISAQITSTGGSSVTERGICWSTTVNPVKTDNASKSEDFTASFTCVATGLAINTTYHARAYAVNVKGTSYGEDLTFKTLAENELPASIDPLLSTKWSVFTWPYNAFYPAYSGSNSINGKLPAPCGPTTLSRVLAFWKGQIFASGTIDALDSKGETRFKVNLDTIKINYNNLPVTFGATPTFDQYKDVAKLFLTSGAVGLTNLMDVATPGDAYINALKTYFNVDPQVKFAKRWEYTREEWINLLKTELAKGHPLMVVARTSDSPKPWEPGHVYAHWFNIEGYDSGNRFYIDYNFDPRQPFNGYYDVDDFGVYKAYPMVIINFKPR
ncbi:MAG: hypothetical protein CVU13_05015 [Bacteroidetes bacterium HGW-Bacteroidetes-8]|jgi:hypothetical protein|nr:MAG: hypothetical protein CVU13_05015 [Bacteroidetes bacterium HGW-Bacteroidetes-8]